MVAFVSLTVLVHPKAFCSTMLGCINAFFIPLSQLNCVFYCHCCALDLKEVKNYTFLIKNFVNYNNLTLYERRIRARAILVLQCSIVQYSGPGGHGC